MIIFVFFIFFFIFQFLPKNYLESTQLAIYPYLKYHFFLLPNVSSSLANISSAHSSQCEACAKKLASVFFTVEFLFYPVQIIWKLCNKAGKLTSYLENFQTVLLTNNYPLAAFVDFFLSAFIHQCFPLAR